MPRVATLTETPMTVDQPPETVPNNPTTEIETTDVPGSTVLDDDLLREAGILDDGIMAPSGRFQAEASIPVMDSHKLCSRVITEAQPIFSGIVDQQLESFMSNMRIYINEQIAEANISQEVVDYVNETPDQQKPSCEIQDTLTRDAMQANQAPADDVNGRLLLKIDNLDKELSTVKTELETYKCIPTGGDAILTNSDTKSRRRDRKSSRRRGSSKGISSDSSSDGTSSEDCSSSDFEKERIRRRALRKTLTELNPSNCRFAKVLPCKNYRLHRRNRSVSRKVPRKVSSWTKRMASTIFKFNGSDPISVIQFLAKFKVAAENNGIPEGGATLVLRNFFSGRAAEAFDASLYVDAIGIDTVGIQTWSDAVHWLLQTFAKDAHIREVTHKLRELQQKDQETENNF